MSYNIKHLLSINASVAQIHVALTTATGIRNWWTDNADLDETRGIFRFHYGQTVETTVKVVLLKDALISWKVMTSFRPEQIGTSISFALQAKGDTTLLHFSQSGFEQEDDIFALMNMGWAYYLVSLKQYLETGKGAPSPHVDFSIIVK